MNKQSRFEECHGDILSRLGAVQTMFPQGAKDQMAQLLEESARRTKNLGGISSTAQNAAVKGGLAAEEWHAGTQTMDAILKAKSSRSYTDLDPEWYQQGLPKNSPSSDIVTVDGDTVINSSQVKYYKSSKATANEMGLLDTETGKPKYGGEDSYIGPSDQINKADGSVADVARQKAAKNAETRPEVSESMGQVAEKATDKLEPGDGTSSKPLTKKEAENLGQQNEKGKQQWDETAGEFQTQSTMQQMGQAAKGAAAITAVSAGVFNTIRYTQAVRDGKMTVDEAAVKIVAETGAASVDCAVKAAANTGVQSVLVRRGGEEAARAVLKNSMGGLMKTSAVTVAVIASVDLAKNLVLLSVGKLSKFEFEERSGKALFNTGAGVYGSAIGGAIGSPFFPPVGTYVGSVLGAMVSGMAMQFAIENGIEKEFREAVQDTERVKDAMGMFQITAGNMLGGQILFERYLEQEASLNADFNEIAQAVEQSGNEMKQSIDRL